MATAVSGDFVIVWSSAGQDGSNLGIFARRFSSAGVALGGEFQVNAYATSSQDDPSVATGTGGDFIVVWSSGGQDGSLQGVFGRRFSSLGVALGSEFQVNTHTTDYQYTPSVAASADGDFVVAWSSAGQDGAAYGIFARRFSSTGGGVGGEFQVNTHTAGNQLSPSLTTDDEGNFVIAWRSFGQDGSYFGVFSRRFASTGVALGGELQVNVHTTGNQLSPSVTADGQGDFVVAWASYEQDGSYSGVFARRFSSAGVALGGEFQVNAFTTSPQTAPSVAARPDGEFVVAWTSSFQSGPYQAVFARRFSSVGAALGSELQINTYTTSDRRAPWVAPGANGEFIVTWESLAQDGDSYGIFAQRIGPAPAAAALDVDGNGTISALTDGLLVLRFEFGFTGATLTAGAVGGGCTRCDAAALQVYLNGLGATLDVDGNGGPLGALTDGLLVMRFLFGFSGATLTSGAVGAGCSRCDAATIQTYLTGLMS